LARKHGVKAQPWRLQPRVDELASALRPLLEDFREGDEVTLRLLCLAMARLELAADFVAERGLFKDPRRGTLWPVVVESPKWEGQVARYAAALGLGTQARSKMSADRGVAGAGAALAAHIERNYGGGS
jgi:hypothetical protein